MTRTYTRQQEETLSYFRKHAERWGEAAKGSEKQDINVIQQRNNYVLDVIGQREVTKMMLDVGCGTGELVCDAARCGVHATGVDFAQEMIQIAQDNARNDCLESAQFVSSSIFDFDIQADRYDLISANGFIEYISFEQLREFLSAAHRGLLKGGSIVLGSRNRLFNLFSLNDFTTSEMKDGTISHLLREAVAIVNCVNLDDLSALKTAPLAQHDETQTQTGIDVFIRYQYTPVQLIHILGNHGFQTVHLAPIHIHAISPKLKSKYPDLHYNLSNLLQSFGMDNRELIPIASSFMIHATKS